MIFLKSSFEGEYKNTTEDFYRNYFCSENEMQEFFTKVFNNEGNVIPCRMVNQVRRFVSLALDIDKIRPGKDMLRISFLRICLESLDNLSNKKISKVNFYSNYLTQEEKEYIVSNFKVFDVGGNQEYHLKIENFEKILYELRNNVFHDGDCWNTQLFITNDIPIITGFKCNNKIFDNIKPNENYYSIETAINLYRYIYIFVKASIRAINSYIESEL